MPKPSKQTIIDSLIHEIESGNERGKVLGKIGKKWELSRTTFDRLWKIAKDQQQERQRKASEAADKAYINAKAEAAKSAVMSKQERLEYLTCIAKGEVKIKKPFVINGKIMEYPSEPDHSDRMKAIAELNKMDGDYAPTKQQIQINKLGKELSELYEDE